MINFCFPNISKSKKISLVCFIDLFLCVSVIVLSVLISNCMKDVNESARSILQSYNVEVLLRMVILLTMFTSFVVLLYKDNATLIRVYNLFHYPLICSFILMCFAYFLKTGMAVKDGLSTVYNVKVRFASKALFDGTFTDLQGEVADSLKTALKLNILLIICIKIAFFSLIFGRNMAIDNMELKEKKDREFDLAVGLD